MSKLYFILFFIFLYSTGLAAVEKKYRTEILDDNFSSLYITKNGNWDNESLVDLNSHEQLEISFDCLSDEIVPDLYYRVKFCNYDWTLNTNLFESEYIDGINEIRIDDYNNSFNTTVDYSNYKFSFPNNDLKPKLSGNYLIEVYSGDEEIILTACVYVLNPLVDIKGGVTNHTLLGNNNHYQQVDFDLSYNLKTTNPSEELKVVVKQNNRLDNMVTAPTPNFIQANTLVFKNNSKLVFDAGNEFFRFDSSSKQLGGMGIEDVDFKNPYYHFYLTKKQLNDPNAYHYDQTQQGKVIYRLRDNKDVSTEGDYFWMHFSFQSDKDIPNNEVYLNGDFTYHSFSPNYQLKYNSQTKTYEIDLLLKQGIYNYQYLMRDKLGKLVNLQGDFFQTKNSYNVYVYFFDKMDRYYQLVGYKKYNN